MLSPSRLRIKSQPVQSLLYAHRIRDKSNSLVFAPKSSQVLCHVLATPIFHRISNHKSNKAKFWYHLSQKTFSHWLESIHCSQPKPMFTLFNIYVSTISDKLHFWMNGNSTAICALNLDDWCFNLFVPKVSPKHFEKPRMQAVERWLQLNAYSGIPFSLEIYKFLWLQTHS